MRSSKRDRERLLDSLLRESRGPGVDLWPGIRDRLGDQRPATAPVVRGWMALAAGLALLAIGLYVLLPRHTEPVPATTTAERADPDLIVLSAKVGGQPARVTVVQMESRVPVVLLEPELQKGE